MKTNKIKCLLFGISLTLSSAVIANPKQLSSEELQKIITTPYSQILIEEALRGHTKNSKATVIVRGLDVNTGNFEVEMQSPNGEVNFFNSTVKKDKRTGKWRVKGFQGHFVDTKLNSIIRGQLADKHEGGTAVSGIEVGRVIYEDFNGWPIDIVGVMGIATHNDKGFQGNFNSYTAMIKLEWKKFPWSRYVRTKIEFGEGLNYAENVPYFEGQHIRRKNQGKDSKLLNYLGLGISFNLGDIFQTKDLDNCYIGGYVYHRSGIFGAVPMFNNVNGGSNYQTTSLECYY